jgi:Kef-type K+ transport system membrane component KefB
LFDPSVILAAQSHGPTGLVRDLLAILAVAALVNLGLRRLKLATIPGYLITGAIIGPSALGLVRDPDSVQAISRIAVIFLMFGVGLSLDLGAVRGGMFPILMMGIASTVLAALVGWPIAAAFGFDAPAALGIATAMTMSSTAVTLRILMERKEVRLPHARVCIGLSVTQDIGSLPVLAAIPLLAAWAQGRSPEAAAPDLKVLAAQAAAALMGVTLLVLVARFVLPRLLREAAEAVPEVMLVLAAAIALGAAALTSWIGLSPELGAFVSGFMLSSTVFRYQIVGQLAPTRDLFMAVFFTAVGLGVSVGAVLSAWWVIALGVLLLVILKWGVISLSAWAFGATAAVSIVVGAILAQAGEFTLVLLAAGRRAGLYTTDQHSALVGTVVASLIVVPALYEVALRLRVRVARIRTAPWIGRSFLERPSEPDGPGASRRPGEPGAFRGIVAGFGPVGRTVADALEKNGVALTVIELNPRTVERQHLIGRRVVYGDASNLEVLEAAGLGSADVLVMAVPDEEATLRACHVARAQRPDLFIIARMPVLSKAIQAMEAGADHTVVDEIATAEALAAQTMIKLGQLRAGEDTGPKLYQFSEPAVHRDPRPRGRGGGVGGGG